MTADDMAESVWITLKDPDEYEGITSAVVGLDGVSQIRDQRETSDRSYDGSARCRRGAGDRRVPRGRGAAAGRATRSGWRRSRAARRSAIMRLVGASTLYIALPFLLEALVTAASASRSRRARWRRSCTSAWSSGSRTRSRSCRGSGWTDYPGRALAVIAILGPCSP